MLWEAVYVDGWANLRSACRKLTGDRRQARHFYLAKQFCFLTGSGMAEVVWRLAKPKNLRGIDWLILVLWSSSRRLTRETSVDNPICKYGTQFFNPNLLIGIEKGP